MFLYLSTGCSLKYFATVPGKGFATFRKHFLQRDYPRSKVIESKYISSQFFKRCLSTFQYLFPNWYIFLHRSCTRTRIKHHIQIQNWLHTQHLSTRHRQYVQNERWRTNNWAQRNFKMRKVGKTTKRLKIGKTSGMLQNFGDERIQVLTRQSNEVSDELQILKNGN